MPKRIEGDIKKWLRESKTGSLIFIVSLYLNDGIAPISDDVPKEDDRARPLLLVKYLGIVLGTALNFVACKIVEYPVVFIIEDTPCPNPPKIALDNTPFVRLF